MRYGLYFLYFAYFQLFADSVAYFYVSGGIFAVLRATYRESSALAVKLGIASIPTLIVFKDGKETSRMIGFRPKDAILAELK